MNRWIGCGRLTKAPSFRYAGELAIARYTLACDRKYKKEGEPSADFISCVAFGKAAEFAEKYLDKGTKIIVSGRIQTGSYEKDGQKIYTTDIVVEEQEFAESKKDNGKPQPAPDNGEWMNVPDTAVDELPFH